MPGSLQVIGSSWGGTGGDKPKKKKKGDVVERETTEEKTVVVCVTGVKDLNELHDWLVRYCGVDNGALTKANVAHGSTSRVSMRLGKYSVVCIGDVPLVDMLTLHGMKFPEVPFQGHSLAIYADAMFRLSLRKIIAKEKEKETPDGETPEENTGETPEEIEDVRIVQSSLDFASSYPIDLRRLMCDQQRGYGTNPNRSCIEVW